MTLDRVTEVAARPTSVPWQARARAYLLARQCVTGGFCAYRSHHLEEPNLFDTWHAVAAGIACCRKPGLAVPYASDTEAFIRACQTGDGGFAAAPGALPTIGLTHLALTGLAHVAEVPSRNADGETHDHPFAHCL